MAKKQYTEAAEIADSINWRKVRNVNALMKAGDIYAQIGRYDEAKEILLMAYDRSPIGRMIIYKLAEIAIKTKEFDEAQEYYDEFVEIAPHDNLKYILRYEMNKAKGAGLDVHNEVIGQVIDPCEGFVKSEIISPTDGIVFFAHTEIGRASCRERV